MNGKSSGSLNSTQENLKNHYCENRDMNLDNVQDVMIEQGCENDEKTSNSSILSVFFQHVNKILQFFAVNRQKNGPE